MAQTHFPVSDLSVTDLVDISSMLKNVITPSFGPNCHPTLITSNTGQVVLTKDGYTILSTLCLSHPAAKCMLKSVFSHSNVYGDGCKTLILYLCELLRGIEKNVSVLAPQTEGSALKSRISLSLHNFVNEDLASICRNFLQSSITGKFTWEGEKSSLRNLKQVIETFLIGNLPQDAIHHLGNLMCDFISTLDMRVDKRTILNLFFKNCVQMFPIGSYTNSYLCDGLFFNGVFSSQSIKCNKNAKFVIALCPLEGQASDMESEYFMKLVSDDVQQDILLYKKRTVELFMRNLKEFDVSLILTSQKIPDFVLNICRTFHIDVVSCLEEEEIQFISYFTGGSPITSVSDELNGTNVCQADFCDQVTCSGKKMLKLILSGKFSRWQAKSLFLHAPTDGLVQQLRLLIKKCFKALSCYLEVPDKTFHPWNSTYSSHSQPVCTENQSEDQNVRYSSSDSYNAICGGGYFEFLLSYLIERDVKNQTFCAEKRIWADLVIKMLESVPQTLFHNLSSCRMNQSSSFLTARKEAKNHLQNNYVVGFNSKGNLCSTFNYGAVDILSVKIASLFAALDLAANLLRIDSIIGVKRLPPDGDQQDSLPV